MLIHTKPKIGCQQFYVVSGEEGAVSCYLIKIQGLICGSVDRHSIEPLHDSDVRLESCFFLEAPCYCDGTNIVDNYYKILHAQGEDALFQALELRYQITFRSEE